MSKIPEDQEHARPMPSPERSRTRLSRELIPQGIDFALGRPVTASAETVDHPASNAVNGDPDTHWCPGSGPAEAQLTVDLEVEYSLNGAGITWVGSAPEWCEIDTSLDGQKWRSLPERRRAGNTSIAFDDSTGPATHARFVRLRFSNALGSRCVMAFRAYSSPPTAARLVRGADLSTLSALEAAGQFFSDVDGERRPCEQILASHGWNLGRLRLWVDPPNEFNGLADVMRMARRLNQANMRFLLCLHYSDFWADPAKQITPAAWQGQDLSTLADTVRDYTRQVVAALTEQGTPPDIAQIGNEVTPGMLWPMGQVYVDVQERWAEFATLLKAGIAGAREGAPPSHQPRIMIHIDRGGDVDGTQRFYDRMRDHGVDLDVIGLSYYPFWHGTLSDVRHNLDNTAARYGKPIVIVETAYPWTLDNHDGYPNVVGPSTSLPAGYPPSVTGQVLFVRDLLSLVARTPGGLGHGIVYWEPAWIPGVGWETGAGNNWDNQTLFDPNGRALASIDAAQVGR